MDANRHGDVITIMAIDIDKFKSVNDMYGHAVGDSVLIAVTDILMKAVRSNDMVFRIGGDEFLVVFPRTECCEIESIKGRLIALVGDWNVTSTLQEYRLNLSVGCVTWNPGENFRARLAEADAAMYEAKSKGGTTVEIPCN
jgi:diguanylate cyclase (GGDEF)-like protein